MKVLFVLSGNKDKSSNLVVNQAESIIQYNSLVKIDYFNVKGKGFIGYLSNIKLLRKKIKEFNPDVIHAHYSFCGFLSALTFSRKPIITSLMGSDLHLKVLWRIILYIASMFWKSIIIKSKAMHKNYFLAKTVVIPNGVDLKRYAEISKEDARKELKLDPQKKYVLFLADTLRLEKNFSLAKEAYDKIKTSNTELLVINNIPHQTTRLYYYAVDVLLLSSIYEGSPNVIKEAMVCNCPIVSTKVGDVEWLFKNLEGCYLSESTKEDFSKNIQLALEFSSKFDRTKGNHQIKKLGIDADSIAKEICNLYSTITKIDISKVPVQTCIKGIWDESIPNIKFNSEGVSNYCLLQQKMMQDYPRGDIGKKTWTDLINKIKKSAEGKKYDCIIGVSGGVDSSYLMHLCVKEGLRPLAVHLDNGFNSEISVNNITKITRSLNIDLVTHVINYEEIKELFKDYMKASLPWIDAPTDLAIKATMYNIAVKHKIKYIIRGNDFRSEGKQPKEWTYSDSRQLKAIHKLFGASVKLKTYPMQSFYKMVYAGFVKKIKDVRPFYYIDYNKQLAKDLLMEVYDWKDYGGHHHENLFTKFAMAYWLPKKFNIDKRKINLSAQVLSLDITREEALLKIKQPFDTPEKLEELKNYILKKLDLTQQEFENIINQPNKFYTDYSSNYNLIYKNVKYFKWIITKLYNFKPMSIDSNEMIK